MTSRIGLLALYVVCTLCAAPSSAQTEPMNLDSLIQIQDPAKCDFGPEFNEVGERLFVIDPSTKKIKPGIVAFPEKYSAAFGKPEFQDQEDGSLVLTLPMIGNWKGFPLVAIVASAKADSQPGKTMFVLKTDYDTAVKRLAVFLGLDQPSVFSIERIADVADYIILNCEKK